MNIEEFGKKLGPYKIGFIKDYITFTGFMEFRGIVAEDLIKFVKKYNEIALKGQAHHEVITPEEREPLRRCPQCDSPLNIMPVNNSPANQVGGKLRSVWFCSDWYGCGYEQYSKLQVWEHKRKIMRKRGK